jgi:hypothetical protein
MKILDSNAGISPDGGATRNFNYPFSINEIRLIIRMLQLPIYFISIIKFMIFSICLDLRQARNFQNTNFGLGGGMIMYRLKHKMEVTNNANFNSPSDGNKPRMQMYLWSTVNRIFYYNAPSSAVPRQPIAGTASFGNALDATGVTGNVQLSSVLGWLYSNTCRIFDG